MLEEFEAPELEVEQFSFLELLNVSGGKEDVTPWN